MNNEILNKFRNEAGFGWGVAMRLYTHDATEMWVEYDKDGEESWPSREIMEKFAELIVQECAEFINGSQDEDPGKYDCKLAYELKEHFGVK